DHGEIAAWALESHRVEIVLETVQMNDRDLLWWILERTRFECETSRRTIRDGVQSAPSKMHMWFVKTFENSAVAVGAFRHRRSKVKLLDVRNYAASNKSCLA
ncbi:hypothetical protein PHMEG_00024985, partial [Phytophthora megakarya]